MNNILFVCMGNICRSPSAEGFFRHHLALSGKSDRFTIDSAGTHSYHIGHAPDPRAISEAARFGVDISKLRARKLVPGDFDEFDLVIGMDEHNLSLINDMKPAGSACRTALMMAWAPGHGYHEVPDPYYGDQSDFSLMCTLLDDATASLAGELA
ncbi:MAG: low molecular weight phosphotyrosine protein phosphatase [Xanthomonadales bacterium]|nr:low molecular weight phosphotyrosine protein phosphatase [Xanthomonadales bacterium]